MAKRTHSKQLNLAELHRIVTGAVSSALSELGSSSSSRAGVIEDESDAESDIEDFVTTPIKLVLGSGQMRLQSVSK